MRRGLPLIAAIMLLASCSGSDDSQEPGATLVIAVNAPFSRAPYVGETIADGAQLAVEQINDAGGVDTGRGTFALRIEKLDNALSPQKALDNVRRAVDDQVVAIIDEGTGVNASWREANAADIPLCVVYQGGEGLIDPETRPNLFRIAPTDHGIAFRYAEYLDPIGYPVAFLHDDSDYGQQGSIAFHGAFDLVPQSTAIDIEVPADATDLAPQVLQVRNSNPKAMLVWGLSSTVATVIRSARSSGWDVPIYTAPSGEDPLVRQQLSDHPEWVDGLTFAAGRLTAERGPGPFLEFQSAYHDRFGFDRVGVQTSEGEEVIQPPDYAMYPYDFVRVLAAAIEAAHSTEGAAIIDALNQVDVRGANGDERGFNEKNHEGVVDDDTFFAVFNDMTWTPAKNDPLSSTLDEIDQTL